MFTRAIVDMDRILQDDTIVRLYHTNADFRSAFKRKAYEFPFVNTSLDFDLFVKILDSKATNPRSSELLIFDSSSYNHPTLPEKIRNIIESMKFYYEEEQDWEHPDLQLRNPLRRHHFSAVDIPPFQILMESCENIQKLNNDISDEVMQCFEYTLEVVEGYQSVPTKLTFEFLKSRAIPEIKARILTCDPIEIREILIVMCRCVYTWGGVYHNVFQKVSSILRLIAFE